MLGFVALQGGCGEGDGDLEMVGTVEYTLLELVAPAQEVIVAVNARRGDAVAAGQVVVQLDPTLADAEIAPAQAELAGAQTAVITAEHELVRQIRLHARDVASETALERAQLERSEAYARLRASEAAVAVARKHRSDLDVRTLATGVLDQIPYDPGERVPLGSVIAVLVEDGDPWVRVWIPEPYLSRVSLGTAAQVRVDGLAEPMQGNVIDIAREPEFTPHYALTERDRVHLVYEARIEITDAPDRLRPGTPADVRIPTASLAEGSP